MWTLKRKLLKYGLSDKSDNWTEVTGNETVEKKKERKCGDHAALKNNTEKTQVGRRKRRINEEPARSVTKKREESITVERNIHVRELCKKTGNKQREMQITRSITSARNKSLQRVSVKISE